MLLDEEGVAVGVRHFDWDRRDTRHRAVSIPHRGIDPLGQLPTGRDLATFEHRGLQGRLPDAYYWYVSHAISTVCLVAGHRGFDITVELQRVSSHILWNARQVCSLGDAMVVAAYVQHRVNGQQLINR